LDLNLIQGFPKLFGVLGKLKTPDSLTPFLLPKIGIAPPLPAEVEVVKE
jgi:hypothetical protein